MSSYRHTLNKYTPRLQMSVRYEDIASGPPNNLTWTSTIYHAIARLNNHFQGLNQHAAVSWAERQAAGPNGTVVWTVKCNIYGETKGIGSAPNKTAAKIEAATQALAALGVPA
ncbi:hypothetical protein FB107DRAFT_268307 [Schizophyllum commune]